MKLKVGDIVRMNFEGLIKLRHRYVVVAVPPTNHLVKGCVDLIQFEDASLPLRKTGTGVPIKYLIKIGRLDSSFRQ